MKIVKKLGVLLMVTCLSVAFVACGGPKVNTYEHKGVDITYEYPSEWSSTEDGYGVTVYDTKDKSEQHVNSSIKIQVENDIKWFETGKASRTDVKDLGSKTIGGVEMAGTSYKAYGLNTTQYIGALDDNHIICVQINTIDPASEGAQQVFDSLNFELAK